MVVRTFYLLALSLLILCGCGNPYEVNAENCAPDNFLKLPDNPKRTDFIEACLKRQTP